VRIVILTAVWKRHELFEIFKMGVERIKDNTDHEVILVTVGSEEIKFSENHLEYPNQPLSDKWQKGIEFVKDFDPDYVLFLGSDDLICSNLINTYSSEMEKGTDLIGLIDCYFLDSRNDKLSYWIGYTNHRYGESIGMARMMSRRLLDKMNWKLWKSDLKKGLDGSMMKNLKRVEYTEKMFNCRKENIAALDIKTDLNVSNIKTYSNLYTLDFNSLSKMISDKEFYAILNLK
jgi:hypothetical protein